MPELLARGRRVARAADVARAILSRFVAAALVLGLAACGPHVLWRARSSDLRHLLEVVAVGDRARAVLDGTPGETFDAIGEGAVVFAEDGAAHYAARTGTDWRIVGPSGVGAAFLDIELPLRVVEGAVLFAGADRQGWRVVFGADIGPAFDAAATEVVVLPGARVAYVGRSRVSERVVVDGVLGAPFERVRLLAFGGHGDHIVYAGRVGGADHLVVGDRLGPPVEEVLELVAAADAPAHAAIVASGELLELLHALPVSTEPAGAATDTLASAPFLSHLRISDDGAHVACLASSADGQSIEVWLDGEPIATHRRVEGERLAFVPGEARLVWLAEDSQGLVVYDGDRVSARFEEVEGPTVAPGRVGFVGRTGGRTEVWIDGVRVADEPFATALRLGPGTHHAFVALTPEGRFVVTRRGRWPVPRFFVDTLVLDETGEHWAALVPDASERSLAVWVDGEEIIATSAEELLGPAAAVGVDPASVIFAAVEAVLASTLAR